MEEGKIRIIKKQIKITWIIYAIMYPLYCFVMWDIVNPFQWIMDIPEYRNDQRLGVLLVYFGYHIILFLNLRDHESKIIKKD